MPDTATELQTEPDPLASPAFGRMAIRVNHDDVLYLGEGIRVVVRKTRSMRVDLIIEAPGAPVQLVRNGQLKVGKQHDTDHIQETLENIGSGAVVDLEHHPNYGLMF